VHAIQHLSLDEALRRILDRLPRPEGAGEVRLADARNCVAAEDVIAPVNVPPFATSAMDGYAVVADGGQSATRIGTSLAGHPFTGTVRSGQCVRITTGAVLPSGADAVAIQEDCRVAGDAVEIEVPIAPGDQVRPLGNDVRAGATIVSRGTVLGAFEVGWLSACGVAAVPVYRRPSVAVFSTGDELREPGEPLDPGCIYDSNRQVVGQLLAGLPLAVHDAGVLRDDAAHTRTVLGDYASRFDALVTSGGVSVGEADHVKDAIEAIGSLEFWRLNLKPGKPVAHGRIGSCIVFGLPGNPVSTIVTLLLIARPALLQLAGVPYRAPDMFRATLETGIAHRPGREEYQRGRYRVSNGTSVVAIRGDQSSNRLASFADANCLVRVPGESGDLAAGTSVDVLPLRGLTGS
jgi:molybdopterin molybdotransferase